MVVSEGRGATGGLIRMSRKRCEPGACRGKKGKGKGGKLVGVSFDGGGKGTAQCFGFLKIRILFPT